MFHSISCTNIVTIASYIANACKARLSLHCDGTYSSHRRHDAVEFIRNFAVEFIRNSVSSYFHKHVLILWTWSMCKNTTPARDGTNFFS